MPSSVTPASCGIISSIFLSAESVSISAEASDLTMSLFFIAAEMFFIVLSSSYTQAMFFTYIATSGPSYSILVSPASPGISSCIFSNMPFSGLPSSLNQSLLLSFLAITPHTRMRYAGKIRAKAAYYFSSLSISSLPCSL